MQVNIPDSPHPRIVVVGGGFGGLQLVKSLKHEPFQIVLIDKNNYHTFQPLLYQVATGGLEADSIAYPLRKIVRGYNNLFFRMAQVEAVNAGDKVLKTSIGELRFDYLVIATGSQPNYFNFESVKDKLFVMKDIPQSLDLRSYLLQNFEGALSTLTSEDQKEILNVIIVGGGPTGVELAGALAEMKRFILPKDYPELDFSRMQIHLFEGLSQLLPGMSDKASAAAKKYLYDMGVEVHLDTMVDQYDGSKILFGDGESIHSATVIWTAGVKGQTIPGLEAYIGPGNRYEVNDQLQIPDHPSIHVIGDAALCPTEDAPKGHPMMAPVAIQQAQLLASNFRATRQQKPVRKFKYHDKGAMATVGKNKAVADIGKYKFQGILAWFLWMALHLMMLAGFRNRLITFIDWTWNYLSYDRALRLIIRPFKRRSGKSSIAEDHADQLSDTVVG